MDLVALAAGAGVLLMLFRHHGGTANTIPHGAKHTQSRDNLHTTKQ